jgi:CorA-like Mg2+ transporter protein
VLLLDPPVIDRRLAFFLEDNDEKVIEKTEQDRPYQGGYRDFTPWPDNNSFPPYQKQLWRAPVVLRWPRTLPITGFMSHQTINLAWRLNILMKARFFLRRIIISMLNSNLRQYYACLSQLETKLWFMERRTTPSITDAQKNEYLGDFNGAINEVNKIRRRMNWFVHDMNANLEILNITSKDVFGLPSNRSEDRDFLAIRDKFADYRTWAENLLDITSTHLALMETEKSISDSRTLSRLTILGSFFVPVSFVCSFFSMNGDLAVGENKLWVYFAMTLPLVVSILVVVFGGWWYKRLRELSAQSYRRVRSRVNDNLATTKAKKTSSKGLAGQSYSLGSQRKIGNTSNTAFHVYMYMVG